MKTWTITFGDKTWTDDDATVAHLAVLTEVLGIDGWEATSPWNGPVILAGWITVLTASATGKPIDECATVVQMTKLNELMGSLAER